MFHCSMECLLIWDPLLVSVSPISNLLCLIFHMSQGKNRICESQKCLHNIFFFFRSEALTGCVHTHNIQFRQLLLLLHLFQVQWQEKSLLFGWSWAAGCCFFVLFFVVVFWSRNRWLCCSGGAVADNGKLTCSWSCANLNVDNKDYSGSLVGLLMIPFLHYVFGFPSQCS